MGNIISALRLLGAQTAKPSLRHHPSWLDFRYRQFNRKARQATFFLPDSRPGEEGFSPMRASLPYCCITIFL